MVILNSMRANIIEGKLESNLDIMRTFRDNVESALTGSAARSLSPAHSTLLPFCTPLAEICPAASNPVRAVVECGGETFAIVVTCHGGAIDVAMLVCRLSSLKVKMPPLPIKVNTVLIDKPAEKDEVKNERRRRR